VNAVVVKVDEGRWLFGLIMAVAMLLALGTGYFFSEFFYESAHSSDYSAVHMLSRDLTKLVSSMLRYKEEYEHWPSAEGLYATLEGRENAKDNPLRSRFFDPDPRRMSPDGTPLDPWKHPYVFDGIVNDEPRFHSIGKDGIDQQGAQGSDDFVTWDRK
jgi:Type II secretion system (T2SS), protein G